MKKIKKADLLMLLVIAVIIFLGLFIAFHAKGQKKEIVPGGTTEILEGTLREDENICSIEIRCDTVLEHMDQLTKEKGAYVPENGIILQKTNVNFSQGETVFDVLKRVCEEAQIQLEYSWTPLYDSYYIEGINHLYEFDCTSQSGWMFRVNGEFPNYGCSAYELEAGDEILWCYTCTGLGADVGAVMAE